MLALLIGWTQQTAAQSTAPHSITAPASKTITTHHKKGHAKPKPVEKPAEVVETKPVEPPKPDWPVNDPPAKPEINWDSKGLRIEATNSSLDAILKEVTTQTGVTVEGLDKDQRIYGVYGPGRARDVLAQLLEGTGYNVLIIGEQAPGTPRQIVLTAKTDAPATTENKMDRAMSRTAPAIEEEEEMPEPIIPNQPIIEEQQNQQNQQNQQPMRPGFQNMPRQPMQPGQQNPQ